MTGRDRGVLRIHVVSPFLDKRHGTERCQIEQIVRWALNHDCCIHIFSRHVADIEGVVRWRGGCAEEKPGQILWHRVWTLPGPGLFALPFWLIVNHIYRCWARWAHGIRSDVLFATGINCFDVDLVVVHIVYSAYVKEVRDELLFRNTAPRTWLRLLYRRSYYRMNMSLEKAIYGLYGCRKVRVVAISQKTASDVGRLVRAPVAAVIPHGVDVEQFSPAVRMRLRTAARSQLRLGKEDVGVLLVGNDWLKKGLIALLEAVASVGDTHLRVLVVGKDDSARFGAVSDRLGLRRQVSFLSARRDIEFYYAAADIYAGPSLEDAFGMPPLEAMACGIPTITSSKAGVSELVTDGIDAYVLQDPRDSTALAGCLRELLADPERRRRMGEAAVQRAQELSWDVNAAKMYEELLSAVRCKKVR